MSYLFDTCILSKLRKIRNEPDDQFQTWIMSRPENYYFVSVLSIGEIQFGISKLNLSNEENKKKKVIFESWLSGDLVPRFKDRILNIDAHTVSIWGTIRGEASLQNRTLPVIDSLIAATAIQYNLILVTENTKDFVHTGAKLLNPFKL
jgi:predicted nucleic acid-binding protein